MVGDELNEVGILHKSLFWSFGIYSLVFIVLVLAFVFYYLMKYLSKRSSKMLKVEMYLKKKLFYNSAIRYMI